MKSIVLIIFAAFAAIGASAQENDTSLLRKLGVSEVKQYQLIHAFVGKNDTCLMMHLKLNEHALDTYSMKNYGCSGYEHKDIMVSTYNGRQKMTQVFSRNGTSLVSNLFEYENESELPSVKKATLLSTGDTTQTKYVYHPRKKSNLLDSTRVFVSDKLGTKSYLNRNKYDKKDNLITSVTSDENGESMAETTLDWNKDGQKVSVINASFGEKIVFEQTFFKYENDRVVETTDTHNRRNVYLYREDGLLKGMHGYNAKGEFEIEFLYDYVFTK